jgi:hypothetical protein
MSDIECGWNLSGRMKSARMSMEIVFPPSCLFRVKNGKVDQDCE